MSGTKRNFEAFHETQDAISYNFTQTRDIKINLLYLETILQRAYFLHTQVKGVSSDFICHIGDVPFSFLIGNSRTSTERLVSKGYDNQALNRVILNISVIPLFRSVAVRRSGNKHDLHKMPTIS